MRIGSSALAVRKFQISRRNRRRSMLTYLLPLACIVAAGSEKGAVAPSLDRRRGERDGMLTGPAEPCFQPMRGWAFITSHARVLLAIARNPELRVEEIADEADVTKRSVYRILADLVEAGYLRRSRAGTRNLYELDPDLPLGDPVVEDQTTSDLLALVGN
jgi:DNA-binding transcriptional ArsR family regulator